MDSKIYKWILIGGFSLVIIYGIYCQITSNSALNDATVLKAKVTETNPVRGGAEIYVEYTFKGALIKNHLTLVNDTFEVGQTILLKVSNQYPRKYIGLAHNTEP